ncbi:hypothetical protein HOP52_04875 [Halomonas campisalis]|uniref:Uncharacterized protein n=1 Tax=Billgrantia campisalis TaxID=74661 RepID=A0ABS9P5Q4_9GAMM|nr:hypothetical protein [Halomonas campisalis]MCG6657111.1 hypothetical protein [Halomonas campisalis]MDR5862296.1 hypothetical protein [Halomonas campisalis]
MNMSRLPPLGALAFRQKSQPTGVISLIEDILTRANEHEHQEYHRYRRLCLRFLTYHIGISQLMQTLAIESQQRIQTLIEVSASLPIEQSLLRDPSLRSEQRLQVNPHFFIFDDEVAAQELSRALLEEWRSRRFYERLQAYNAIPGLDAWLNDCIGQRRAQFQILQEARDQLPAALTLPAPTSRDETR